MTHRGKEETLRPIGSLCIEHRLLQLLLLATGIRHIDITLQDIHHFAILEKGQSGKLVIPSVEHSLLSLRQTGFQGTFNRAFPAAHRMIAECLRAWALNDFRFRHADQFLRRRIHADDLPLRIEQNQRNIQNIEDHLLFVFAPGKLACTVGTFDQQFYHACSGMHEPESRSPECGSIRIFRSDMPPILPFMMNRNTAQCIGFTPCQVFQDISAERSVFPLRIRPVNGKFPFREQCFLNCGILFHFQFGYAPPLCRILRPAPVFDRGDAGTTLISGTKQRTGVRPQQTPDIGKHMSERIFEIRVEQQTFQTGADRFILLNIEPELFIAGKQFVTAVFQSKLLLIMLRHINRRLEYGLHVAVTVENRLAGHMVAATPVLDIAVNRLARFHNLAERTPFRRFVTAAERLITFSADDVLRGCSRHHCRCGGIGFHDGTVLVEHGDRNRNIVNDLLLQRHAFCCKLHLPVPFQGKHEQIAGTAERFLVRLRNLMPPADITDPDNTPELSVVPDTAKQQ